MKNGWTYAFAALLIAVGLGAAGWFVARGLAEFRSGDRTVTVKGLAERDVAADLALWPIRFVATSKDLAEAQAKITDDSARVLAFLGKAGIGTAFVEPQSLEVTDLLAQAYRSGPVDSRYIVTATLAVRTTDVDAVQKASQRIGELVQAGIILGGQQGPPSGPFYLYTRLNDIKPAMIAEATKNARASAEQFAADSGSRIGGIRHASQGLFQILPRDSAPGVDESRQIQKTVRVVSTVEYALKD